MTEIVVYIEGGGRKDQDVALRQAFRQFLKPWDDQAKACGARLTLSPRGDRQRTWSDFTAALERDPGKLNLLLVDAERPVAGSAWQHLQGGEDQWKTKPSDNGRYHLMAQTMESWLVANPESLAGFYGTGFRASSLPKHADVEAVAKDDVNAALAAATKDTKKGTYHKAKHGFELLGRCDPAKTRARAKHCDFFLAAIEAAVEG